jgi:hypothetical protein
VKEVRGEEAAGLGFQERRPLASGRLVSRCGSEAGLTQDAADAGCADLVAEAVQFAVDAAGAPTRVLDAEPDDQVVQLLGYRWPSWRLGLGPLLFDQVLVPGEQGTRRDDSVAAQDRRQ